MTAARAAAAIAVALLVGPLPGCRCDPPPPADRVALLVGVDRQADPGIDDLPGAANDVKLMRALLIERYGFSRSDIVTLTSPVYPLDNYQDQDICIKVRSER